MVSANYLLFGFLTFTLGRALQPSNLLKRQHRHPVGAQKAGSQKNIRRRLLIFGISIAPFWALENVSKPPARAEAMEKAAENTEMEGGLVSSDQLANLLRAIPTFTIVDPKGVPYMVVGEDAKVTGYFFTEYDEAKRVLDLARESATKAIAAAKNDPKQSQEDELVNPWTEARISSVPLDFAITLATKSLFGSRRAGGNYFQIAASEDDIEDALKISGKDDLAEGKVPLFYMEDFEIKTTGQTPLYFSKNQLVKAYRREKKAEELPDIKVTEMFAVLLEMVRPDGTDKDLQKLVFVPPDDSLKRAKDCVKVGGKESPYFLGKRNIVL